MPAPKADPSRLAAARADVNAFIEYCFADRFGEPVRQGAVHREWHQLLDQHPRVLIEAPRDHAKTTQLAVARPIYELGKNPNLRIKLVCQSEPKARERLSEIRAHIILNARIREVFPGLVQGEDDGGDWNKTRLTVRRSFISKDPSVEAHGVASSGTGGRADLIIFDDVVDLRNAVLMPALREVVKTSYKAVWINLLEPDGRAWYVATPWHKGDLTHELRRNKAYVRRSYAVGPKLEPVWPEVWDEAALQARLDEIGHREFARAFQLVALSDEDMTFPSFEKVLEQGRGIKLADLPLVNRPRYTGLDLSSTKRKGTVFFTGAVLEDGRRVPVEIRRGAWKSPETVRQATEVNRRHRPQVFNVENNGLQEMVLDWIREAQKKEEHPDWIPLTGFHTGSQKADPNVGLPSIEVELASGGWLIPYGEFEDHEDSCNCGWCEWSREMRSHPIYETTDTVMAMWFMREAARVSGPKSLEAYTSRLGGGNGSNGTAHVGGNGKNGKAYGRV